MLAICYIDMLPAWEDIGSAVRRIVLRSIYVSVFVFQLAHALPWVQVWVRQWWQPSTGHGRRESPPRGQSYCHRLQQLRRLNIAAIQLKRLTSGSGVVGLIETTKTGLRHGPRERGYQTASRVTVEVPLEIQHRI